MKQILGSRHQIHTDRKRRICTDDRYNRRERQNNSRYTFGTEEQIEELHRMHRQSDKIQGSRYKGTNDKDRQWTTLTGIHRVASFSDREGICITE